MKYIKKLILTLVFIILPTTIYAASGTVRVTGPDKVVQGNTATYTVTLSSSTAIGSWQMQLDYNTSFFKLISATSEAGGTRMADSSSSGIKTKTYTFKLQALKTGSSTVKVTSYLAFDFKDMKEMTLTSTGKSTTIITQAQLEASYSKNNNLKNLFVEGFDITPTFSKDVLEYEVIVPENTKTINIQTEKEDSRSKVSGDGEHELSPGDNKFNIVVISESGSDKTYILNVIVKDANPIVIKLNDEDYTVVKIRELLPENKFYEEKTITISEFEIPAYYNEKLDITLVGLKDSGGKINLFMYNDDNYFIYQELTLGNITIIPSDKEIDIKGYTKSKLKLKDITYNAYKSNKDSKYYLIQGRDINTGKEGIYLLDEENESMILYPSKLLEVKDNNIFIYLAGLFIFISLVEFILIIKRKK